MPSNRILGKTTTTSQIHKNHDSKLKLKSKQTERWWFCFLLVRLRRADSSSYSRLLEEKKKTWGYFLCLGLFLLLAASKFNHLLSPPSLLGLKVPTFALRRPPLSPCNLLHHLHLLMVHASALSPDDAEGEKCSHGLSRDELLKFSFCASQKELRCVQVHEGLFKGSKCWWLQREQEGVFIIKYWRGHEMHFFLRREENMKQKGKGRKTAN